MMSLVVSQLDGLVVYPDGQLPGLYQRQVIFFPVVDVVFGLAHLLCLVIIPGDWEQMAGLFGDLQTELQYKPGWKLLR